MNFILVNKKKFFRVLFSSLAWYYNETKHRPIDRLRQNLSPLLLSNRISLPSDTKT